MLLSPEQERALLAEVELRSRLSMRALAARYGITVVQLRAWLNYQRNGTRYELPKPDSEQFAETR